MVIPVFREIKPKAPGSVFLWGQDPARTSRWGRSPGAHSLISAALAPPIPSGGTPLGLGMLLEPPQPSVGISAILRRSNLWFLGFPLWEKKEKEKNPDKQTAPLFNECLDLGVGSFKTPSSVGLDLFGTPSSVGLVHLGHHSQWIWVIYTLSGFGSFRAPPSVAHELFSCFC